MQTVYRCENCERKKKCNKHIIGCPDFKERNFLKEAIKEFRSRECKKIRILEE